MAIFEIEAYPAKPSNHGGFSVVMYLDGRVDPVPTKRFEAKTTSEVEKVFEDHLRDLKDNRTEGLAVCVTLLEGRAPKGFREWEKARPFYHPVNV